MTKTKKLNLHKPLLLHAHTKDVFVPIIITTTNDSIYVKNPYCEDMAIKFDYYGETKFNNFKLFNIFTKRIKYALLKYCKDINSYYAICEGVLYNNMDEALEAKKIMYGNNNEVIIGEVSYEQ